MMIRSMKQELLQVLPGMHRTCSAERIRAVRLPGLCPGGHRDIPWAGALRSAAPAAGLQH